MMDRPCNDSKVDDEIKAIRTEHKDYGYRRVFRELLLRGYNLSKYKVQRLMKKIGLQVTSYTKKSRKYNSYKGLIGTI